MYKFELVRYIHVYIYIYMGMEVRVETLPGEKAEDVSNCHIMNSAV